MAVLLLVVERGAPLQHLDEAGRLQRFARPRRAPHVLGEVEQRAAVAVRHAEQRVARVRGQRQRPALHRLGTGQQLAQRLRVEGAEHQDASARQQGAVELEGRVLGGGADQRDGAVLHHGEEAVLLGAIEAMDLVDEEQRAAPGAAADPRLVEQFFQIGHAREDRRHRHEVEPGLVGQQARHRGLARTRRAPKDQRTGVAAAEQPRQRPVRPDEMPLPRHLVQAAWPQPVGQRARTRRRGFGRGRRSGIEAGGGKQVAHGWALIRRRCAPTPPPARREKGVPSPRAPSR